jgi:SPP1 family predicted phage head-tail adaptor
MRAGKLRQRIDFQKPVFTQDPVSGEMIKDWIDVWIKVPASVEPLSAREFISAADTQAEVTARIGIRSRAGVNSTMRIIHRGKVYNIEGVLPDPKSGLEYLTLPCSEGVNDG